MRIFDRFRKSEQKVPPSPIETDHAGLAEQCVRNVLYLRAHINTLNGVIENLKSGSSRLAKMKIVGCTKRRDWLVSKLEEESFYFKFNSRRS
jgi:hypothetical protein